MKKHEGVWKVDHMPRNSLIYDNEMKQCREEVKGSNVNLWEPQQIAVDVPLPAYL